MKQEETPAHALESHWCKYSGCLPTSALVTNPTVRAAEKQLFAPDEWTSKHRYYRPSKEYLIPLSLRI